jgi:CubicO group peptidase (beta-lactamase class C family)
MHTILLAKFAAVATALGVTVLALHAVAGLIWPLALNGTSRGPAIQAPRQTYDGAIPPVAAADLQTVMDRDLAGAIRSGFLAPGAGGGVSIGIYQRGVRRVFSYGAAAPDSIFQIGSATKLFTGLLLADMAERGVVALDQPVRELIPAAGVSRPAGNEIRLLDLATHRSGLPPMPASFRPANSANPAADFDVARLYNFLRGRGVGRRADAPFIYSNLGFGLLAHALSQRAGADYATLLRQVIAEPLGMNDTTVNLSPDQQLRFIHGYDDYRRPVPAWDFDALAGAGGLRSTAPDMLSWLEANLHPERVRDERLSKAIASSHQVHSTMNSSVDIALAWWFYPDSGVFEHGGSLLGFTADTFFHPNDDVAVVVLSNVGPGTAVSAETIGEHIRARLDGKPAVSLAAVVIPPTGGVRGGLRLLVAYWITMTVAGIFTLGLAMTVQGVVAAVLPRRYFLRVSSWLQLATFCLVVGTYFLQPMVIRPDVLRAAQSGGVFSASPSLWFLGMLQELSGSPALAPLAASAWIGLGVIGTGGRGTYVMGLFQKNPEVDVRALCDVYPARFRDALSTAPGAKTFADHRKLLELAEIDAVLIGSPDHWHKDHAVDAMNAGKDVYSEKPMCRLREEAPLMVKAARATGRILQIGLQQRSGEIYLEPLEKFVKSGVIGNPSSAVRNAEGQTVSPVLEFTNSEPRMPGIMITGRFPGFVLASAKILSRLGVRCAEIHPADTDDRRSRRVRSKLVLLYG